MAEWDIHLVFIQQQSLLERIQEIVDNVDESGTSVLIKELRNLGHFYETHSEIQNAITTFFKACCILYPASDELPTLEAVMGLTDDDVSAFLSAFLARPNMELETPQYLPVLSELSAVFNHLAAALMLNGQVGDALLSFYKSLWYAMRVHGTDAHTHVLSIFAQIQEAYMWAGRMEESERIELTISELRSKMITNGDDPGSLPFREEQTAQPPTPEQAAMDLKLKRLESLYGTDNEWVVQMCHSLAQLCLQSGQLRLAKSLLTRKLDWVLARQGPAALASVTVRRDLAALYMVQANFCVAEVHLQQANDAHVRQRQQATNSRGDAGGTHSTSTSSDHAHDSRRAIHDDEAAVQHLLAKVLHVQGQLVEAADLYEEAYQGMVAVHGPASELSACVLKDLAACNRRLGSSSPRLQEVILRMQHCLELFGGDFGSDSDGLVLPFALELAEVCLCLKDFVKAEALLRKLMQRVQSGSSWPRMPPLDTLRKKLVSCCQDSIGGSWETEESMLAPLMASPPRKLAAGGAVDSGGSRRSVLSASLLHACSNPSCGESEAFLLQFQQCAHCQQAYYCSVHCKTQHWPAHKPYCTRAEYL